MLKRSDEILEDIARVEKELAHYRAFSCDLDTRLDQVEEEMAQNDFTIEELEEELIDLQGRLAAEGAGDES